MIFGKGIRPTEDDVDGGRATDFIKKDDPKGKLSFRNEN